MLLSQVSERWLWSGWTSGYKTLWLSRVYVDGLVRLQDIDLAMESGFVPFSISGPIGRLGRSVRGEKAAGDGMSSTAWLRW